jgi:hypothetical protein
LVPHKHQLLLCLSFSGLSLVQFLLDVVVTVLQGLDLEGKPRELGLLFSQLFHKVVFDLVRDSVAQSGNLQADAGNLIVFVDGFESDSLQLFFELGEFLLDPVIFFFVTWDLEPVFGQKRFSVI